MSFIRAAVVLVVITALFVPTAFASRVHRAPTSGQSSKKSTKTSHTAKSTKASVTKKSTKASRSTRRTKATKVSRRTPRRSPKKRGQQEIAPDRITEIQQALIREHYLSGDPSGQWDTTTQSAMQKFQKDQGWQTRLTPDSRALKKLGLGPDYSNAINAKDSTFAAPPPVNTIPAEQASGFASAAGVNQ